MVLYRRCTFSAENHQAAANMDVPAAPQVNPGARMSGRERSASRQRERERAADEAAIHREESIQAAMDNDPNISHRELERMIDEAERDTNDAN